MSTIAWGHVVVDRRKTCKPACRFLKIQKMMAHATSTTRAANCRHGVRAREPSPLGKPFCGYAPDRPRDPRLPREVSLRDPVQPMGMAQPVRGNGRRKARDPGTAHC
jgi:hypothetical protein